MIGSSHPACLDGSRSTAGLEHLLTEARRRGPPGASAPPASYQPQGWDMPSIVPLFVLYYSSILPLVLAVLTPPTVLHPWKAPAKSSGLDFGGLVTQPPATVAIQRRPARRAE